MSDSIDQAKRKEALAIIDQVYGPGSGAPMATLAHEPYVATTIDTLFGEVWNRPHLSIRDRRLLVIGATAMLGRPDLIEFQVAGAIVNNELDNDALQEVVLQLAYYCGWGNATAVRQGIEAGKKKAAAMQGKA
jgi:alkylhydroperoxidase/carboxymuconolactone decarboxylase family protein YurZ